MFDFDVKDNKAILVHFVLSQTFDHQKEISFNWNASYKTFLKLKYKNNLTKAFEKLNFVVFSVIYKNIYFLLKIFFEHIRHYIPLKSL